MRTLLLLAALALLQASHAERLAWVPNPRTASGGWVSDPSGHLQPLTVARMARGPSSLDRVVAADVLVAVVIATLAAEAILNDHATTLPVMLVLSLLGFAGAVSIARFVAERDKAARWNVQDQQEDASSRQDLDNRERRS